MTRDEPGGACVRCALAAAGVLVFFSGLDNYAFGYWSGPRPVYLVLSFLAVSIALALYDVHAPLRALWSPLMVWTAFYFVLSTLWAVWMRNSPVVMEAWHARYRSVGFLVAFAFIFEDPRARRMGALAAAAAVVLASCLNVLELFGILEFQKPEDLSGIGRAAGFFVNPNAAGIAIAFGVGAAISSVPRKWRIPLITVGAVGIAATFSRGAELCYALLILYLVWRREVPLWPIALACLAVAVIFSAHSVDLLNTLSRHDALNEETMARLSFHGGDSGRSALAVKAWRMFLDAPLLGKGLGATIDWEDTINSSHNQFLNLAGDHGILGLVAFPALGLALFLANRSSTGFALALMAAGAFSHNLLDDRAILLTISLAASRDALPLDTRVHEPPATLLDEAQGQS